MTDIKFIGAYRVVVPVSEWEAAISCHDNRKRAAEELDTLALIELEVRGARKGFCTTGIKQPHTECVPYNESFFEVDTLRPIETEQYKVPVMPNFRVAFHLHHYDPSEVLETPFGNLRVGPLSDPPAHLTEKQYVFWD